MSCRTNSKNFLILNWKKNNETSYLLTVQVTSIKTVHGSAGENVSYYTFDGQTDRQAVYVNLFKQALGTHPVFIIY